MKGKFYGIGVGPGDPELLTVKAVRILGAAEVVISPESRTKESGMAFSIAKRYLKKDAELLSLRFPMTYDRKQRDEQSLENSRVIIEHLEKGKNVAFITVGDPLLYSTYIYLLQHLKNQDVEIETIPGITSFSAAAGKLNLPLAEAEETLGIIPLMKNGENLIENIEKFDNLVILKPSANSPLLARQIEEKNLENNFVIISRCCLEDEEISRDITLLREDRVPYFSVVILKKKKKERHLV